MSNDLLQLLDWIALWCRNVIMPYRSGTKKLKAGYIVGMRDWFFNKDQISSWNTMGEKQMSSWDIIREKLKNSAFNPLSRNSGFVFKIYFYTIVILFALSFISNAPSLIVSGFYHSLMLIVSGIYSFFIFIYQYFSASHLVIPFLKEEPKSISSLVMDNFQTLYDIVNKQTKLLMDIANKNKEYTAIISSITILGLIFLVIRNRSSKGKYDREYYDNENDE